MGNRAVLRHLYQTSSSVYRYGSFPLTSLHPSAYGTGHGRVQRYAALWSRRAATGLYTACELERGGPLVE